MASNELDGKYIITTTTNYDGPFQKKSDGETRIVNGQTHRRDDANCIWTSTFTIINDQEVEMISTVDPSEADDDFALTRENGMPTDDAITYKTKLKLIRKDDKIQMSGKINYGDEITFLTLRKIGEAEEKENQSASG